MRCSSIITLGASCGAVYCNRSCLCVCGCVTVFVFVCGGYYHDKLEIACIDPHQTGFVGKGSDHLQLIKFWPSCAPGKGSAAGRKLLAPITVGLRHFLRVFLSALSFAMFSSCDCRSELEPGQEFRLVTRPGPTQVADPR